MYRAVVHFVQPNGCTPGGWGRGERAGGKRRGLTMSSIYVIMEVRDFRITQRIEFS